MRLWQLFSFEPEQTNVQHKELTCKSNTKWKMANRATRCKRKLKSRASRNQESARERQDSRQVKRKGNSGPTSWQGRELSMPKNTCVEQELRVVKSEKLVMNSRVGENCDRLVRTEKTRSRLHSRSLVSLERENQGGDRAERAGDCRVTVPTGI